MQRIEENKSELPKVGEYIRTPRFGQVRVKEVFTSYWDMISEGYKEPTHFIGEYEIKGKSIGVNRMVFGISPRRE